MEVPEASGRAFRFRTQVRRNRTPAGVARGSFSY
jgi:hypothetical protein